MAGANMRVVGAYRKDYIGAERARRRADWEAFSWCTILTKIIFLFHRSTCMNFFLQFGRGWGSLRQNRKVYCKINFAKHTIAGIVQAHPFTSPTDIWTGFV